MSEAGPQVNGPSSPTGKYIDGIDPDDPQYIKNLQRPAEVKEDLQQMENRSRVSLVLNSQAFKDELEQVVEEQLRNGPYPASLLALQQITDLLLPHSRGSLGSLARSSCVIPINDLRGVESLSFAKGEKLLRCKLAALYRLVDLCGWSHGINNHISARVSSDTENFLVNPFGLTYSEVTASSLLKVDVRGEMIEPGSTHFGVNRAGFSIHSAIHQARPDIKCIVHLHNPAAVAVSAMKCGLIPMSQEALICGHVSYHDYQGIAFDAEDREKLARSLGVHNKILILRNQGVVACGETVEEAFHFTFNVMAACEAQVKTVPLGLDNIVIPSKEAQEQVYRVANQGGGGVESTGRKWKTGELEFEALMRSLDNSGYRTGYVFKMPVVKQEKKERSNSEVEIPPASSSFTYIFDGDYEHSKYASPIKAAMERQKKAYKAGWLTTPNTYKKTEVEEIGTTTPKKITKWVPEGDSPNRQGCTPVRIENPNQFAPQGSNPKEFKERQKSIKKDYYEEKITAGPQSKILEGITWDEAQKVKDGQLSGAGDQLIVVGAASKGIIQRDHQHNAVVYRQYYAANPFENMSEAEIEQYQAEVQRKERGEPVVEQQIPFPSEELPVSQQPPEVERQETEVEGSKRHDDVNGLHDTSKISQFSQGPRTPREEQLLAQLADKVVQTVIRDALSVIRQGKGQQILTGAEPLHQHPFYNQHPMGGQMVSEHRNFCKQGQSETQNFSVSDINDNEGSVDRHQNSHQQKASRTHTNHIGKTDKGRVLEDASGAAAEDMGWHEAGASNAEDSLVTIHLNPIELYHGHSESGAMKVKFSIQSTVRRRVRAGMSRGGIIKEIYASVTEPVIEHYQNDSTSFEQSEMSAPLDGVRVGRWGERRVLQPTVRLKSRPADRSAHIGFPGFPQATVHHTSSGIINDNEIKRAESFKGVHYVMDKAGSIYGTRNTMQVSIPEERTNHDFEKPFFFHDNSVSETETYGKEVSHSPNFTTSTIGYNGASVHVNSTSEAAESGNQGSQTTECNTEGGHSPSYDSQTVCAQESRSGAAGEETSEDSSVTLLGDIEDELMFADEGWEDDFKPEEEEEEVAHKENQLFQVFENKGSLQETKKIPFSLSPTLKPQLQKSKIRNLHSEIKQATPLMVPAREDSECHQRERDGIKKRQAILKDRNDSSKQLYLLDTPFSSNEATHAHRLLPLIDNNSYINDLVPAKKMETIIDDIDPSKKMETIIDDIVPLKKMETSIDDIVPSKKMKTIIDDIVTSKKMETIIDDIPSKKMETVIDSMISSNKMETVIDDIVPSKEIETSVGSTPIEKAEAIVGNHVSFKEIKTSVMLPPVKAEDNTIFKKMETDIIDIVQYEKNCLVQVNEGPIQTSSPKPGRVNRKESSFKSYPQKFGKSEETLLEIMPLECQMSNISVKSHEALENTYIEKHLKAPPSLTASLGPHPVNKKRNRMTFNSTSKETMIEDILNPAEPAKESVPAFLDRYNLMKHNELMELIGTRSFFRPPVILAYPVSRDIMPPLPDTTDVPSISDTEDRQRRRDQNNPSRFGRDSLGRENPADAFRRDAPGRRTWTPKQKKERKGHAVDEGKDNVSDDVSSSKRLLTSPQHESEGRNTPDGRRSQRKDQRSVDDRKYKRGDQEDSESWDRESQNRRRRSESQRRNRDEPRTMSRRDDEYDGRRKDDRRDRRGLSESQRSLNDKKYKQQDQEDNEGWDRESHIGRRRSESQRRNRDEPRTMSRRDDEYDGRRKDDRRGLSESQRSLNDRKYKQAQEDNEGWDRESHSGRRRSESQRRNRDEPRAMSRRDDEYDGRRKDDHRDRRSVSESRGGRKDKDRRRYEDDRYSGSEAGSERDRRDFRRRSSPGSRRRDRRGGREDHRRYDDSSDRQDSRRQREERRDYEDERDYDRRRKGDRRRYDISPERYDDISSGRYEKQRERKRDGERDSESRERKSPQDSEAMKRTTMGKDTLKQAEYATGLVEELKVKLGDKANQLDEVDAKKEVDKPSSLKNEQENIKVDSKESTDLLPSSEVKKDELVSRVQRRGEEREREQSNDKGQGQSADNEHVQGRPMIHDSVMRILDKKAKSDRRSEEEKNKTYTELARSEEKNDKREDRSQKRRDRQKERSGSHERKKPNTGRESEQNDDVADHEVVAQKEIDKFLSSPRIEIDLEQSPRLSRRYGGAISKSDDTDHRGKGKERRAKSESGEPIKDREGTARDRKSDNLYLSEKSPQHSSMLGDKKLASITKSTLSLASTHSRKSMSGSPRVFENSPENLPPVPQIDPLTGMPFIFIHPLMKASMENLHSLERERSYKSNVREEPNRNKLREETASKNKSAQEKSSVENPMQGMLKKDQLKEEFSDTSDLDDIEQKQHRKRHKQKEQPELVIRPDSHQPPMIEEWEALEQEPNKRSRPKEKEQWGKREGEETSPKEKAEELKDRKKKPEEEAFREGLGELIRFIKDPKREKSSPDLEEDSIIEGSEQVLKKTVEIPHKEGLRQEELVRLDKEYEERKRRDLVRKPDKEHKKKIKQEEEQKERRGQEDVRRQEEGHKERQRRGEFKKLEEQRKERQRQGDTRRKEEEYKERQGETKRREEEHKGRQRQEEIKRQEERKERRRQENMKGQEERTRQEEEHRERQRQEEEHRERLRQEDMRRKEEELKERQRREEIKRQEEIHTEKQRQEEKERQKQEEERKEKQRQEGMRRKEEACKERQEEEHKEKQRQEEMKRQEEEEHKERQRQEEEHKEKQRQEEMKRQEEEEHKERQRREAMRRQEEWKERQRQEEIKRQEEERKEKRRQKEIKRQEEERKEIKRQEEERKEIKRQEEERKERQKQEDMRREIEVQKEKQRQEEIKLQEEEQKERMRQEENKERQRQEEIKRQEEERKEKHRQEEIKRQEEERKEKHRQEEIKRQEEERKEKQRHEEIKRQIEERKERHRQEEIKKQEQEQNQRQRQEEIKKQEQEQNQRQRQEEIKRQEERKERQRQEEIKRQEERKEKRKEEQKERQKQEEIKKQEEERKEKQRQEEIKRQEEEQKERQRQEEIKGQEEEHKEKQRQEEIKRQEEQKEKQRQEEIKRQDIERKEKQRQEEIKRQEERKERHKQEEIKRQIEERKERHKQEEIKRQIEECKERQRQEEIKRQEEERNQRQRQEEERNQKQRQEEIKRQEERNQRQRQEEIKRQEERNQRQRQEEIKRREEEQNQRQRQKEIKRQEEERNQRQRQEEIKRQEEERNQRQRQEEIKRQEEERNQRQRQEEIKRQEEQNQRQRQEEIKRQEEQNQRQRQEEIKRQDDERNQRQRQEEIKRQEEEQNQRQRQEEVKRQEEERNQRQRQEEIKRQEERQKQEDMRRKDEEHLERQKREEIKRQEELKENQRYEEITKEEERKERQRQGEIKRQVEHKERERLEGIKRLEEEHKERKRQDEERKERQKQVERKIQEELMERQTQGRQEEEHKEKKRQDDIRRLDEEYKERPMQEVATRQEEEPKAKLNQNFLKRREEKQRDKQRQEDRRRREEETKKNMRQEEEFKERQKQEEMKRQEEQQHKDMQRREELKRPEEEPLRVRRRQENLKRQEGPRKERSIEEGPKQSAKSNQDEDARVQDEPYRQRLKSDEYMRYEKKSYRDSQDDPRLEKPHMHIEEGPKQHAKSNQDEDARVQDEPYRQRLKSDEYMRYEKKSYRDSQDDPRLEKPHMHIEEGPKQHAKSNRDEDARVQDEPYRQRLKSDEYMRYEKKSYRDNQDDPRRLEKPHMHIEEGPKQHAKSNRDEDARVQDEPYKQRLKSDEYMRYEKKSYRDSQDDPRRLEEPHVQGFQREEHLRKPFRDRQANSKRFDQKQHQEIPQGKEEQKSAYSPSKERSRQEESFKQSPDEQVRPKQDRPQPQTRRDRSRSEPITDNLKDRVSSKKITDIESPRDSKFDPFFGPVNYEDLYKTPEKSDMSTPAKKDEKMKYAGFVKRTGRSARKSLPVGGNMESMDDTNLMEKDSEDAVVEGEKSEVRRRSLDSLIDDNPLEMALESNNNKENESETPPATPKRGILNLFSCVGGRSAEAAQRKRKSKKIPYYGEGEKRKIKKLSKNKKKADKKVLYFENEKENPDADASEPAVKTDDDDGQENVVSVAIPETVTEPGAVGEEVELHKNRIFEKKTPPRFVPPKPHLTFIDMDRSMVSDDFSEDFSFDDNLSERDGKLDDVVMSPIAEESTFSNMRSPLQEGHMSTFSSFGKTIIPSSSTFRQDVEPVSETVRTDVNSEVPDQKGETKRETGVTSSSGIIDANAMQLAEVLERRARPSSLGLRSPKSSALRKSDTTNTVFPMPPEILTTDIDSPVFNVQTELRNRLTARVSTSSQGTGIFKPIDLDDSSDLPIPPPDEEDMPMALPSPLPLSPEDFDSSDEFHDTPHNLSAPSHFIVERDSTSSHKHEFDAAHDQTDNLSDSLLWDSSFEQSSFETPDLQNHRKFRTVSFTGDFTSSVSSPPAQRSSEIYVKNEAVVIWPRSLSTTSNPLMNEPWRAKAQGCHKQSMSVSDALYVKGGPRPCRSHSIGEIYNRNVASSVARRRSQAPLSRLTRMYQPRQRSRSHTNLGNTSFGSVAPARQRSFSGYDHSARHAEPSVATVKRSESERKPSRNPHLEQVERKNVERTKSDRRPQLREELGEDKPASPSKSDTLRSTDSASGGETLEERSSKEGSPTKEHPSPTKEKKKKKKFRIPSFSKKKSKESKESAI